MPFRIDIKVKKEKEFKLSNYFLLLFFLKTSIIYLNLEEYIVICGGLSLIVISA